MSIEVVVQQGHKNEFTFLKCCEPPWFLSCVNINVLNNEIGAATMENSMRVSQKIKNRTILPYDTYFSSIH